jgi:chaperonin GroES
MKSILALSDKVIVKVIKRDQTKGGIIIPENVINEPQGYGKVVSIGTDIKGLNVGDVVLFAQFAGQDILLDRNIMKVLKFDEIYGVLDEYDENEFTGVSVSS